MIGTGTISAATLWFDDGQLHVYQCLGIVWAILRIFEGNFQQLLDHFGSCLGNLWASLGYFGGFFVKTLRNRPRGRAKKLDRSIQFLGKRPPKPRNWLDLASFVARILGRFLRVFPKNYAKWPKNSPKWPKSGPNAWGVPRESRWIPEGIPGDPSGNP